MLTLERAAPGPVLALALLRDRVVACLDAVEVDCRALRILPNALRFFRRFRSLGDLGRGQSDDAAYHNALDCEVPLRHIDQFGFPPVVGPFRQLDMAPIDATVEPAKDLPIEFREHNRIFGHRVGYVHGNDVSTVQPVRPGAVGAQDVEVRGVRIVGASHQLGHLVDNPLFGQERLVLSAGVDRVHHGHRPSVH